MQHFIIKTSHLSDEIEQIFQKSQQKSQVIMKSKELRELEFSRNSGKKKNIS